jgi:hypothetical protein
MRGVRFGAAVLLGAAALAASALAGDSETKVPGVGGVSIRWNDIRYRKQLIDQLQPGLTWRLGAGTATRVEVTGMVLAGDGGLIFPGEATFNLRYWSADKWSLVAFEENDWKWTEAVHHFAVIPCSVWKEKDPKKAAEKLTLAFRSVTGKTRSGPPSDDVVTPSEGARPKVELPSPVTYSKEAQAEADKAPWVEMEMRFGDLVGLVAFEAAEAGELKTKKADEKRTPLSLRWPQFTSVRAKTELVETGTELTLGLLKLADDPAQEFLLVVAGGENPEVELRRIGKDEKAKTLDGKRVATKTAPKSVAWECDGKSMTLHLFQADYVFPVP